ncbi:hypothetical protein BCU31_025405 [Vibrio lentus]
MQTLSNARNEAERKEAGNRLIRSTWRRCSNISKSWVLIATLTLSF